jgi:hypothetical protein
MRNPEVPCPVLTLVDRFAAEVDLPPIVGSQPHICRSCNKDACKIVDLDNAFPEGEHMSRGRMIEYVTEFQNRVIDLRPGDQFNEGLSKTLFILRGQDNSK